MPKNKNKLPKHNAAVVMNEHGHEVRTYSLKQHGEKYLDLAKEYTSHTDTKYIETTITDGIDCPACGHNFVPKNNTGSDS